MLRKAIRRSVVTTGRVERSPSVRSLKRARLLTLWLLRLTAVGVVLGSWQLSAAMRWVDPLFTSSPSAIWQAFLQTVGPLATQELPTTLTEMLIGLLLGVAVGFVLGAVLSSLDLLNDALRPLYVSLNSVPRIALAPLFIVWFGLGIPSKVALAFTLVVFIVMLNTISGLTQVDRDVLLLSKSMGVTGWRRLRTFLLPSAIPSLAVAVELGIVYSFLGAITGELVGGSTGLGVVMTQQATEFRTADFFATLFLLALVATGFTQVVHLAVRRVLRWHYVELKGVG